MDESSFRISDADRHDALQYLESACGEGRLTLEEYEERATRVTQAVTEGEMKAIFADLPQRRTPSPMYSRQDIEEAYVASRRPRAAAVGLSAVVGLIGAVGVASAPDFVLTNPLVLFFVMLPVIAFLLLYVAKIGPAEWHAPSPAQLRRVHLRELKEAQRVRALESKAARQEASRSAANYARDVIERRRQR